MLAQIKGIKIAYQAMQILKAYLKLLLRPKSCHFLGTQKGLYWSKVPGTEDAKTIEPAEDYILPFGKANIVKFANEEEIQKGRTLVVLTYGMGVYWAKAAKILKEE